MSAAKVNQDIEVLESVERQRQSVDEDLDFDTCFAGRLGSDDLSSFCRATPDNVGFSSGGFRSRPLFTGEARR
jgi:hypothetical protein